METQNIKFDYYNSRFSYLKFIMEYLHKSESENMIVGEIFNNFLSKMDSNEIKEIILYSALFENNVLKMSKEKRDELLNNIYDCYIKSMMAHFSNKNMEALAFFYNKLSEKIKIISGYYGLYGDNGYFDTLKNNQIISR